MFLQKLERIWWLPRPWCHVCICHGGLHLLGLCFGAGAESEVVFLQLILVQGPPLWYLASHRLRFQLSCSRRVQPRWPTTGGIFTTWRPGFLFFLRWFLLFFIQKKAILKYDRSYFWIFFKLILSLGQKHDRPWENASMFEETSATSTVELCWRRPWRKWTLPWILARPTRFLIDVRRFVLVL